MCLLGNDLRTRLCMVYDDPFPNVFSVLVYLFKYVYASKTSYVKWIVVYVFHLQVSSATVFFSTYDAAFFRFASTVDRVVTFSLP